MVDDGLLPHIALYSNRLFFGSSHSTTLASIQREHVIQGYYFTGDGCHRDSDGFYWITGRVDDVLNVSGHRIGTAEVCNQDAMGNDGCP